MTILGKALSQALEVVIYPHYDSEALIRQLPGVRGVVYGQGTGATKMAGGQPKRSSPTHGPPKDLLAFILPTAGKPILLNQGFPGAVLSVSLPMYLCSSLGSLLSTLTLKGRWSPKFYPNPLL